MGDSGPSEQGWAAAVGAIDAVVLDVDGTVATCPIDFGAMRAEVRGLGAKWGLDTEALGGRGVLEQIERGARKLGEQGKEFRQEAERAVVAREVKAARAAVLLPGAAEALGRLRGRGFAVALITRNCRPAAEIVLRGLSEYDALLAREDVPCPKPDPDHVRRSLAAVGRTAECTAMVGDHTYDMEAGRAAGVRLCMGVRTGSSSDGALLEAGADVVLDSIAEVADCLLAPRGRGR